MPRPFVNPIVGSTLYASTFGRGIWKTDLSTACPFSILVSGTQTGRVFYEVGTITVTATLENGAGTEIYTKAVDKAVLLPSFRANAGSGEQFRAWIANCGAGGGVFIKPGQAFRQALALRSNSGRLSFKLPYGALVAIYAVDENNHPKEKIGPSFKMQAGDSSLDLPADIPFGKLMMVVDGQIAGYLQKDAASYRLLQNSFASSYF